MRVVDLLSIPTAPFEDLWVQSQEVSLQTARIRIASIDHPIALKREAGWLQYLAEIEQLKAIRRRMLTTTEVLPENDSRS